jgi:hypothetical protein
VGLRLGLDDMEKRKFLLLPGLELRPLGRPARSHSLYRLCYPDSPIEDKNMWPCASTPPCVLTSWFIIIGTTLRVGPTAKQLTGQTQFRYYCDVKRNTMCDCRRRTSVQRNRKEQTVCVYTYSGKNVNVLRGMHQQILPLHRKV